MLMRGGGESNVYIVNITFLLRLSLPHLDSLRSSLHCHDEHLASSVILARVRSFGFILEDGAASKIGAGAVFLW